MIGIISGGVRVSALDGCFRLGFVCVWRSRVRDRYFLAYFVLFLLY